MIYFAQAQDLTARQQRMQNLIAALHNRKCISLFIEPASVCNLKCRFCGFQKQNHIKKKGIMDASTIETLGRVLRHTRLKFQNINFYNHGEPLCNKHLPEIIRSVTGIVDADTFKIVTNGVLLKQERLIELIDSGINAIKVSLDVGTRARFLALKGADLFDIVHQNIWFAIDYISRNSLDVNFVIKTCIPKAQGAVNTGDKEAVISLFEHVCKDSPNIHIEIVREYSWTSQGITHSEPCEAPFTQCAVNFDGVISGCCADTEYALQIGKVTECESLDEVIYGQEMQRIRKSMLGVSEDIPLHCKQCGIRTCVNIAARREDILKLI